MNISLFTFHYFHQSRTIIITPVAQLFDDGNEGAAKVGEAVLRMFAEWNYPVLLGTCEKQLQENFGHSETLYACNTYQFNDYSRYAFTYFSEEDKRKYRDEHFPQDLKNAYELGKRLVCNCRMG